MSTKDSLYTASANSLQVEVYLTNFAGNINITDEYNNCDNYSLWEIYSSEEERTVVPNMYGVNGDIITFNIMPTNPDIEYQIRIGDGEIIYFSGITKIDWEGGSICKIYLGIRMVAVHFNIGDGTAQNEDLLTQEIVAGGSVTAPNFTPPMGYSFKGWDKSLADITADLAVDGVVTITAIYNILQYSISCHTEEVGVYWENTQDYNSFLILPKNNPEKTGHYFLYWEDADHNVYDNTHKVTAALELFAVFERNEYTVTFYDESKVLGERKILYGDAIQVIQEPQKDGYSFQGWYTDKSLQDRLIFNDGNNPIVECDTSIYAKFEPKNITITYKDNLQEEYQQYEVPAFSKVQLEPTQRDGYKVTIEATDTKDTQYTIENMELLCSFHDIEIAYTYEKDNFYIAFACPMLPDIELATIEVPFEESITLPSVTEYGYNFLGFYKDADFTEEVDYGVMPYSASPDKTTIIYIKLEKSRFTVSFDTQDAQENYEIIMVEYMDSIELGDYQPRKENMDFLGWLDSNGQLQAPSLDRFVIKQDTCFTAKFQLIDEKFNINFVLPSSFTIDLGGGKEYIITISCPADMALTYNKTPDSLQQAQAEGHTFLGWFTDVECTSSYVPIPIARDTTLYGKFERNMHTVTFVCNDKTITKKVEYYSVMPTLETEEVLCEYYTFSGWDKTVDYITEDIEFIGLYVPLYNIVVLDKDNQILTLPTDCQLDAYLATLDLALEEGELLLGWKLEVYDQDANTFAYVPNIVKSAQPSKGQENNLMLTCSLIANLVLLVAIVLASIISRAKISSIKMQFFSLK